MNYARIFGILKKLGIDDETRKEIISNYTNGRTSSLKELSYKEYNGLCESLENHTDFYEARLDLKKWRSNCLHVMQKIGVDTSNWNVINKFTESPKIANKKFAEITQDELVELYKKLQSILKKKVKQTI